MKHKKRQRIFSLFLAMLFILAQRAPVAAADGGSETGESAQTVSVSDTQGSASSVSEKEKGDSLNEEVPKAEEQPSEEKPAEERQTPPPTPRAVVESVEPTPEEQPDAPKDEDTESDEEASATLVIGVTDPYWGGRTNGRWNWDNGGENVWQYNFAYLLRNKDFPDDLPDQVIADPLETEEFSPLTFTKEDMGKTFEYTVQEYKGTYDDIIYPRIEYKITVTVGETEDGSIDLDVKSEALGEDKGLGRIENGFVENGSKFQEKLVLRFTHMQHSQKALPVTGTNDTLFTLVGLLSLFTVAMLLNGKKESSVWIGEGHEK